MGEINTISYIIYIFLFLTKQLFLLIYACMKIMEKEQKHDKEIITVERNKIREENT